MTVVIVLDTMVRRVTLILCMFRNSYFVILFDGWNSRGVSVDEKADAMFGQLRSIMENGVKITDSIREGTDGGLMVVIAYAEDLVENGNLANQSLRSLLQMCAAEPITFQLCDNMLRQKLDCLIPKLVQKTIHSGGEIYSLFSILTIVGKYSVPYIETALRKENDIPSSTRARLTEILEASR